jgi:LSD1 subclass zinc finger protein
MPATVERCETCHALVDVEDLFCANCGTEIPDHQREKVAQLSTGARNFECQGCGASMNYDAGAQSLKCPFCGSVDLTEEAGKGILAPEFIVPFTIDHDEAVGRLRDWLGRGFWRPDDLKSSAQLTDLRAVYVPFWIFTTRSTTHWTADSGRTPPGARASWYPVSGWHESEYADLWVPAGGGLKPEEIEAVLPFDTQAAVPPDGVDLGNVTVEQFSVSRRYARPMAQSRVEALEVAAVQTEIGGSCRNIHVNILMVGATSRAALLPIFVMAYRYREKVYRFVMNGQTGRATGSAPTSMAKVAMAIALGIVVILLIVLAIAR